MTTTSTSFTGARAPCGRVTDGEHYQDEDEECLVTDRWHYSCGCQVTRHEYHDGSFNRTVVRHDGKVLVNELNSEHPA
jgi:hypothetical protein